MPYIRLENLEVYQLARDLSKFGWRIFGSLGLETRKLLGDQFMRSTDSFGANIAEGYNRFHYLEKIKFFYTARASLEEAMHWMRLLQERGFVTNKQYEEFSCLAKTASVKLQNLIAANYRSKNN